jgi:hypothetical protein
MGQLHNCHAPKCEELLIHQQWHHRLPRGGQQTQRRHTFTTELASQKYVIQYIQRWNDPDLDALIVDYNYMAISVEESFHRLENMLPVVASLVQVVTPGGPLRKRPTYRHLPF